MKKSINKYWLIITLIILIIAGIVFRVFTPSSKNSVGSKLSLHDINAGNTTQNKLIKILGEPLNNEPYGNGEILHFTSEQPYTEDSVYISDGIVQLYRKKINSNPDYLPSTLSKQFSEQPSILYGPDSGVGYNLYVFNNNGVAVLASEIDKNVLEVWIFNPLNKEYLNSELEGEFSTTLQKDPINFNKTDPEIQLQ